MRRPLSFIAAAPLMLAACVACTAATARPAEPSSAAASTSTAAAQPEKREFLFQVMAYKTQNQGGQTMNMYFHYRYNTGIAESQIPNYEDLRKDALIFMNHVDPTQNPYWETLNKQICGQLKAHYPVEAISCQLQVYPDDRTGVSYEPGFHSSIDTIGNIESLVIPGPPDSTN